jgi:hypothetical protein
MDEVVSVPIFLQERVNECFIFDTMIQCAVSMYLYDVISMCYQLAIAFNEKQRVFEDHSVDILNIRQCDGVAIVIVIVIIIYIIRYDMI